MSDLVLYLFSWVITALLLYIGNTVFPDAIVLGTYRLSLVGAALSAGFWISLLIWVVNRLAVMKDFDPKSTMGSWVFAILVGAASVWITARLAPFTGLGLLNYRWAILLGVFVGISALWVRSLSARKKKTS